MKHYNHIREEILNDIFLKRPSEFTKDSPKEILSKALGAALYTPATRETIAEDILNKKYPSLTTLILDLEDAVGEKDVKEGEENLIKNLNKINKYVLDGQINESSIPILFLRVRNVEQFKEITKRANEMRLLTGFVFPKFTTSNANAYLTMLDELNKNTKSNFYCMPILETKEIMYKELRMSELMYLKGICDSYKELILNIRIGGTDFSSLYSIRRTIDTTVYDVILVKDCICDILNVFNRTENEYIVSGVVWEYFSNHHRLLKPTLRETPFIENRGKEGKKERKHILDDALDGLIKEIIYDKLNGITGKTIIHPTHITYVNAMQVVTQEEYEDALMVLNNNDKGVLKSNSQNKMNEIKPHYNWANKILQKAEIYGVLKDEKNYNWLF